MDGKQLVIFLGCRDHSVKRRKRHCNGLFADNVFARVKRLDRNRLVKIVGGGDGYDIHRRIRKQLLKGLVHVQAVRARLVALCGIDIVYARHFADIALIEWDRIHICSSHDAANMPLTHAAVADDRYSFLHKKIIPSALPRSGMRAAHTLFFG